MTTQAIILLSFCVLAILSTLANLFFEYSRVLMMMQQNSYRIDRYRRWLKVSADSTSYPRIVALMVFFASMASWSSPVWGAILIILFASGSAIVLSRKKYKKPIVWTARVKRIFSVMCGLSVLIAGGAFVWGVFGGDGLIDGLFYSSVALTGLYCGSHIIVIAAVCLLAPVERSINRKYYNEAAEILAFNKVLKVVGITGSYGKTSTKHYLYRILSEEFETLMTPGSFNTTLGVIRTVREMMKPYCEVFICEMGAKQIGDIKEICDLVHPNIGIVTAVGPQHLESFKTIENVCSTKFELVDALPADGVAIVNNDFPAIADRKVNNVECIRYGVVNPDVEYRAVDISYSVNGTTFTVVGPELKEEFRTLLMGECNVSNLVAAIICALRLGMSAGKIRQAVERIEPVEHRLSMKRTPGGITILDDAFNSNPSGSSMALDVLAMMNTGRRIIITPGMIELGDEQFELNRKFGEKIASSADVAIVVGEYNREAIVSGIRSVEGVEIEVIEAPSFAVAQQTLNGIARRGDVVLYENDLPDTFK